MDVAEVLYKLRLAGKTQAQVARELDISLGQVGNVIHGRATSRRVASYIAALIDCKPEDISRKYTQNSEKHED